MKNIQTFFSQWPGFKRISFPQIIITSVDPVAQPLILSKPIISILLMFTLYAMTGLFMSSFQILDSKVSRHLFEVQQNRNQNLLDYYNRLADSIDVFFSQLLLYTPQNLMKPELWTKNNLPLEYFTQSGIINPFLTIQQKVFHPLLPNLTIKNSPLSLKCNDITKPAIPFFSCPVPGRISSQFGMRTDPVFEGTAFHKGIDIATPTGTPIYNSSDGIVLFCGWKPRLGYTICINHSETNFITVYGHLRDITISKEDSVFQGQVIGHVGSTGKSTGPHLHFEIRFCTKPVNPIPLLMQSDTLLD
jgi:murein DD-endopeptidase MepM/ murein hydrolase activator NlpD